MPSSLLASSPINCFLQITSTSFASHAKTGAVQFYDDPVVPTRQLTSLRYEASRFFRFSLDALSHFIVPAIPTLWNLSKCQFDDVLLSLVSFLNTSDSSAHPQTSTPKYCGSCGVSFPCKIANYCGRQSFGFFFFSLTKLFCSRMRLSFRRTRQVLRRVWCAKTGFLVRICLVFGQCSLLSWRLLWQACATHPTALVTASTCPSTSMETALLAS